MNLRWKTRRGERVSLDLKDDSPLPAKR